MTILPSFSFVIMVFLSLIILSLSFFAVVTIFCSTILIYFFIVDNLFPNFRG